MVGHLIDSNASAINSPADIRQHPLVARWDEPCRSVCTVEAAYVYPAELLTMLAQQISSFITTHTTSGHRDVRTLEERQRSHQ